MSLAKKKKWSVMASLSDTPFPVPPSSCFSPLLYYNLQWFYLSLFPSFYFSDTCLLVSFSLFLLSLFETAGRIIFTVRETYNSGTSTQQEINECCLNKWQKENRELMKNGGPWEDWTKENMVIYWYIKHVELCEININMYVC